MSFDVSRIRQQFPLLSRKISGAEIAYLDNAATTQKPMQVLERIRSFYEEKNANVNRGVHPLTETATVAYDMARKTVATCIGADLHEVIFTRNATESINLIARSFGETLKKNDCIALSALEHHSNLIPWLQLRDRKGVEIDWASLESDGRLNIESLKKILTKGKTRLVSITGLSNVLGVATPLKDIISLAHEHGSLVCIDAAQLIAHTNVDVKELDVDFLAFSGHKIYGPLGIGVLFGKRKLLESMPAFLGGGDMLQSVDADGFTPAEIPRKFEAGTPNIEGAVGLAEAIAWTRDTGTDAIHAHTKKLLTYARGALQKVDGLTILGPKSDENFLGCVSFTIKGTHPHDLTEILGRKGVCLRAGHHCTQMLHKHLGIPASARLSVAAYNTEEEINRCIDEIKNVQKIFRTNH